MRRVRELIDASAAEWNVSARVANSVFWAPIVGGVLVAASRVDKDVYRFLLTDDGPVEWAQFVCFLLAFVASALVAMARFRQGHPFQGGLFAVVSLGLGLVTGEEISWGQRLLDFATPAALAEINTQEEVTLHNIEGVLDGLNLVVMFGGFVVAFAWYLNQKARLQRYWADADHLFVPPVFLAPAFLAMPLYRLVRLTLLPESGFTVTKYSEWGEFCLAFAVFAFLALNWWKFAKRGPTHTMPAPPTGHPSAR